MKTRALYLLISLMTICTVQSARAEGEVDIKPRAGVIIHQGTALDEVSPLIGVQADWDIDDTFNLRLGYEYAKIDVSDGSELKLVRMPVMVMSELFDVPVFDKAYFGLGLVYTSAHYSDGHYPDVNSMGPGAVLGIKLNKHLSFEAAWDHFKKYGRKYGGITLIFTYDNL